MCVQLAESQLFSEQRVLSCVYEHNNNYHQLCSPLSLSVRGKQAVTIPFYTRCSAAITTQTQLGTSW